MAGYDDMVKAEVERLRLLLVDVGVSDTRLSILEPVIVNASWMKVKLDKTRDDIKTSSVVIPYDNGGGQKGLRENPLFKGYEALWKSYFAAISKILESVPADVARDEVDKIEKPQTMLELVRSKHKKEA